MGWFRRTQDEADPVRPDDGPTTVPGPAPVAPAPGARADGGAWRAAPPLPLLVQRELRTNVPATFRADLTSWQSPARLGPLGHLVVADGPAGVLTDLNTSLPAPVTLAPDPAADTMPVAQRSTAAAGPGAAGSVTVQRFAPAPDVSGRLPALFTSAPEPAGTPAAPVVADPSPRPSVVLAAPRATQPVVEPDVVALPVLASQPAEPPASVVQTLDDAAASAGPDVAEPAPSAADEPSGAADAADPRLDDRAEAEPITAPTLAVEHLGVSPDGVPTATTTTDAGGPPRAVTFPFASPAPGAGGDAAPPSDTTTSSGPVAPVVQRRSERAGPDGPPAGVAADPTAPAGLGLPISRLAGDAATIDADTPEPAPLDTAAAEPPVADPSGADPSGADPSRVVEPPETAPLLGYAPLLDRAALDPDGPTPAPGPATSVDTSGVGPTVRSAATTAGARGAAAPPAGLGLPLVARLADPSAGPTLPTDAGTSSSLPAPPVQRTAAATGSAGPTAGSTGPVAPSAGPLVARYAAPEPVTISRWADTEAPPETGASTDWRGPDGPTDSEVASGAGPVVAPEIAPLLGDRPALSVLSVPDEEPPRTTERPAPAPVDPPAVPVSFVPAPSMPAVLGAADVHRPTSSPGATASIQRLDAPAATATSAPAATSGASPGSRITGTSLAAPVLPSVRASTDRPAMSVVQRAPADLSFAPRGGGPTGIGARPLAGPSAGDVAVSSGLGSWAEDGSVVFAPPGESVSGDADAPVVPIQRVFDGGSDGDVAGHAPTAVPSLQLVAGGAAGAGAPGGGGSSDAELDELARRLYGRIRVHLRRELTLDRERSGSLIDVPR